ncbi:hypothetical protein LCGC14_2667010, partial [marine sediment metagenome]
TGSFPNSMNEKYSLFTKLLTIEEWTFLRDDRFKSGYDNFFIVHNKCPKGLNIRPEGAVMHYQTLRCQQCDETPSDEMMAVYVLYSWHNEKQFGAFDDGIIE